MKSPILSSGSIILYALLVFILIALPACESPEEPELSNPPALLVPGSVDKDGNGVFQQNRIYAEDYSNAMHAVSIIAGLSRASELGSENYRPELPEGMGDRAQQWLELVRATDSFFNRSGLIIPWFEQSGEQYASGGSPDLAVYPHVVYAYHLHHRSGRFTDFEGMYDALNIAPTNYIVSPGRYLLNNHYKEGFFFHHDGTIDNRSMSYGIGGIHGHVYAWVVWAKPAGADNMGLIDEERLIAWMGYSKEEIAEMALETAQVLNQAWDDDAGIYDFSTTDSWSTGTMPSSAILSMVNETDGKTWSLDAIGAMIRGHKALYDALYMFGDDEESAKAAQELFERSVVMFERVMPLAREWGLPNQITFGNNGASAATDEVDVYNTFQFLNHLGGGYGWDREREGMAAFLGEQRPDIKDAIGKLSDMLLGGALVHMMQNDRLASTVSYEDGSITDETTTISAAGMFVTAAGNMYRKGEAFERASDWPNLDEDLVERSRNLYDAMMSHHDLIVNSINGGF